jgi:hypothetical protein
MVLAASLRPENPLKRKRRAVKIEDRRSLAGRIFWSGTEHTRRDECGF